MAIRPHITRPEEVLDEHPAGTQREIRSSKYLNNLIEQDHRLIKLRLGPVLGLKRFGRAGIERTRSERVSSNSGSLASEAEQLPRFGMQRFPCDPPQAPARLAFQYLHRSPHDQCIVRKSGFPDGSKGNLFGPAMKISPIVAQLQHQGAKRARDRFGVRGRASNARLG
jgi:hypothetical protein